MNMRETISGNAQACRPKDSYQDYLARMKLTEDLSPEEKMSKIANLCRIFERGAQHLSDNLQPGEVEKRIQYCDGVPCSADEMILMLEENEHVVDLMGQCIQDMDCNPLSKVNGTSLVFAECSKIYQEQKLRLETGKKALAGLLHPDKDTLIITPS